MRGRGRGFWKYQLAAYVFLTCTKKQPSFFKTFLVFKHTDDIENSFLMPQKFWHLRKAGEVGDLIQRLTNQNSALGSQGHIRYSLAWYFWASGMIEALLACLTYHQIIKLIRVGKLITSWLRQLDYQCRTNLARTGIWTSKTFNHRGMSIKQ